MIKNKGKSRVVIEGVKPVIDCGEYPARRIVGEFVHVSADLLGDGHDIISGEVLYRHSSQKKWTASPLKFINDDRWKGNFKVLKTGTYQFTVQAWIDHPATWQHDIDKKIAAGLNVSVELQAGAEWLKKIARIAVTSDATYLKNAAKLFLNEKQYGKSIAMSINNRITALIEKYPLRTNTTIHQKNYEIKVDPKKFSFSSWYEFFPRSTAQREGVHGTFKDCEQVLPLISRMGFDVLYFPPIHPIGEAFRKGKNNSTTAKPREPGSPWAIGSKEGGHKTIHKELGTLDDFVSLVKLAKVNGIDIALDLAFQCSQDHPYVTEHPEWFKWRPDGTIQYAENPPKKYQDVLPLNFESNDWKNLWEELKSIAIYWIEQGVTIFRVDNPHTKPFDFWEWLIAEIHKDHPEVIFLAEAFTRHKIMAKLAKIGFSQSYTYFSWRQHKEEFVEYMNELTKTELRDYFGPSFWPNTPDINPYYLQNTGFSASAIRFILAATLSSSYGMYGPVFELTENAPVPGKEEYLNSEKYEIRKWDWQEWTPFREMIAKINKIRKENAALQNTHNIVMCETDNNQIISYFKSDEIKSNILYIVVNLDPYNTQHAMTRLPLGHLDLKAGKSIVMHDLLTNAKYMWNREWNYVELRPNELPAHIFRISFE